MDREPVSMWLHNSTMENSAEDFAAEPLRSLVDSSGTSSSPSDCSINPDTPDAVMDAARAAVL